MKSILFGLATAVMLIAAVALGAQKQDQVERQLKAAINTQLVDGNLKAAIEQYKKVADSGIRPLAVQALLHMAECYQKMGDAQSQRVYQQIVHDYSEQKDAVALAHARMGGTLVAGAKRDLAVWSGPKVDGLGQVSPDGRFILARDTVGGNLIVHDIASNVDRALTPPEPPENWSQFVNNSRISRDGKQVVYVWWDNYAGASLRSAKLQGSGFLQPREVFRGGCSTDACPFIGSFDVSPDQKWIAAEVPQKDGTYQITFVGLADGSFRILKTMGSLPQDIFFSPDGKYIAYDRPTTGTSRNHDVFVLPVDGSGEVPAVVHSANDTVMGWSPDGERLLFSSDRFGSVGLFALPFVGGKAHDEAELLKSDIGSSVSLGLTTSGALYRYKRINTRDITIAPIDLDAGKLIGPPVGFTQGFIEATGPPHWSPDGKYLTYQVPCNNGCIAIRSVVTGEVRRLAPNMTNSRGVMWSPDGRSLLAKGADSSGREGIFQIDVKTGEAKAVTLRDGLTTLAQWSPDSKKVYFNPNGTLVERDLVSGAERNIYEGVRNGSISPDGQYFALVDTSTKSPSLLLVPVSGGPPRELLHLSQSEALSRVGVWTPDSRAIIVTKDTGARRELWLIPVTGTSPRKLDIDPDLWSSGPSELLMGFSLSPDGHSVAGQTGKNDSEVWAVENFLPASAARK